MKRHEYFVEKDREHLMCKLYKSIYGLKQLSRQWYPKFHDMVVQNEFIMVYEEHCVYPNDPGPNFVFMTPYVVDGILIVINSLEFLTQVRTWLSSLFEMKDMGETTYILEIQILRDRHRRQLGFSQDSYINKKLEKFNVSDCKSIETPVYVGNPINMFMCPNNSEERNHMKQIFVSAHRLKLDVWMVCTQSAICHTIDMVCQYQVGPILKYWHAVKRVMLYLKGTANYALCYRWDLRRSKDFHTALTQFDHGYVPKCDINQESCEIQSSMCGATSVPSLICTEIRGSI